MAETEMVERVAKVLQDCDGSFGYAEPTDPAFLQDARRAIRAMRECTKEMRNAAVVAVDGPSDHMSAYHCAGLTWQAMIDEALK